MECDNHQLCQPLLNEDYTEVAEVNEVTKSDTSSKIHQKLAKNVYFIRQKIEIAEINDDHINCGSAMRIFVGVILVVYMYGAM